MISRIVCLQFLNAFVFANGDSRSGNTYEGVRFSPLTPYQTEDSLPPPVFGLIEARSNYNPNSRYLNNSNVAYRSRLSHDSPSMLRQLADAGEVQNVAADKKLNSEVGRNFRRKDESFPKEPHVSPMRSALRGQFYEDGKFREYPPRIPDVEQPENLLSSFEEDDQRNERDFLYSSPHRPPESEEENERITNNKAHNDLPVLCSVPGRFYGYTPLRGRPSSYPATHYRPEWIKLEQSKFATASGERFGSDSPERQTEKNVDGYTDRSFAEPYSDFDKHGNSYFSASRGRKFRNERKGMEEDLGSQEGIRWTRPVDKADGCLDEYEENDRNKQRPSDGTDSGIPLINRNQRRRFDKNPSWIIRTDEDMPGNNRRYHALWEQRDHSKEGQEETNKIFQPCNTESDSENQATTSPLRKLSYGHPNNGDEREKQEVEPAKSICETNDPSDSSSAEHSSEESERGRRLGKFFGRQIHRDGRSGRSSPREKESSITFEENGRTNNLQQTERKLKEWDRRDSRPERLIQYENKLRDIGYDGRTRDLYDRNNFVHITTGTPKKSYQNHTKTEEDHIEVSSNHSAKSESVKMEKHHAQPENIDNKKAEQPKHPIDKQMETFHKKEENSYHVKRATQLHNTTTQNDNSYKLDNHRREKILNNASKTDSWESIIQQKGLVRNDTQQTNHNMTQSFAEGNARTVRKYKSQDQATHNSTLDTSESEKKLVKKTEGNSNSTRSSLVKVVGSSDKQKKQRLIEVKNNDNNTELSAISTLCDCSGNTTVLTPTTSNVKIKSNLSNNNNNNNSSNNNNNNHATSRYQNVSSQIVDRHEGQQKRLDGHNNSSDNMNNHKKASNNYIEQTTVLNWRSRLESETHGIVPEQKPKSTLVDMPSNLKPLGNRLMEIKANKSEESNDSFTDSLSNSNQKFGNSTSYVREQEKPALPHQLNGRTDKSTSESSNHETVSANGSHKLDCNTESLREYPEDASSKLYLSKRVNNDEEDTKLVDRPLEDCLSKNPELTSAYTRVQSRHANAQEERTMNKTTFAEPGHPDQSYTLERQSSLKQRNKMKNRLSVSETGHERSREEYGSEITKPADEGHIYGRYSPLSGPFPDTDEEFASSSSPRYLSRETNENRPYPIGTAQRFRLPARRKTSSISHFSRGSPSVTQGKHPSRPLRNHQRYWSEEPGDKDSEEEKDMKTFRPNRRPLASVEEDRRSAESDEYMDPNEREQLQRKEIDEQSSSTEERQQPNSDERDPSQAINAPLLDKIPSFEDWIASIPGIQQPQLPFAGLPSSRQRHSGLKNPFANGAFRPQFPPLAQQPGIPNFAEFLPQAQSSLRRIIEKDNSSEHEEPTEGNDEHDHGGSDRSDGNVKEKPEHTTMNRKSSNIDSEKDRN